jgi:tetratricopeptide (TPR) repeat protein
LQQSQWAKAADAFEQAAALHPLAAETYVQWGMAPAQLKRYQEAIGKFAQAVALNPQEAMAYNTGALHSANWTVIRRPLSSSSRP